VIRKNNSNGMSCGLSRKTVLVMQAAEDWCRRDSAARWKSTIWQALTCPSLVPETPEGSPGILHTHVARGNPV
jgi:hypothetical protein